MTWRLTPEQLESRILFAAGDPLTEAAPAFDTAAPAASEYQLGNYSVAEQTGAATYSYPIPVPPGRNQMAPQISLDYSSRAPLRGGVAAGWNLSLPSIELEISSAALGEERYTASLIGAAGRLIETPDTPARGGTTYRIEQDNSFTIFERYSNPNTRDPNDFAWLARTPDGVLHSFGASTGSGDGVSRWSLNSQIDRFGNEIRYFWTAVRSTASGAPIIDYSLERIEYSSNAAAGLQAHAKVQFNYAPLEIIPGTRTPVGAQPVMRGGKVNYEGARRLTSVAVQVRDQQDGPWRTIRNVGLHYDMQALGYDGNGNLTGATDASPMRFLEQISVEVFSLDGRRDSLLPVTFTYGEANRPYSDYLRIKGVAPYHSGKPQNLQSTVLDVNGDGMLDRVTARLADGIHSSTPAGLGELVWHAGMPGGGFATDERTMALPTMPWRNSTLTLNSESGQRISLMGQYTDLGDINDPGMKNPDTGNQVRPGQNGLYAYRFSDFDGDGDVDLMTTLQYDPLFFDPYVFGPYGPEPRLPGQQQPAPVAQTTSSALFAASADAAFAEGSALDVNGDGEVGIYDLLATTQHLRNPDPAEAARYDFNRDGLVSVADLLAIVQSVRQRQGDVESTGSASFAARAEGEFDENPVPEPELVARTLESMKAQYSNQYVWRLFENVNGRLQSLFTRNDVDGSSVPTIAPYELQPAGGEDLRVGHGSLSTQYQHHAIVDVNGDGKLDLIGDKGTLVGDGQGRFTPSSFAGVDAVSEIVTHDQYGNVIDRRQANQPLPRFHHTLAGIDDINGDGLPDLLDLQVITLSPGGIVTLPGTNIEITRMVAHLNTGAGFDEASTVIFNNSPYDALDESKIDNTLTGSLTRKDTYFRIDVDGDGLTDLVDVRESLPKVYFNVGDGFLPSPRTLSNGWLTLAGRAINQPPPWATIPGEWAVMTDFLDVTGDGLRDLVQWGSGGTMVVHAQPIDGDPPRSLVRVDNGVGGSVEFHYSPINGDDGVVARPMRTERNLPHSFWVVDTITVGDRLTGVESKTAYDYYAPVYGSASGREDDPRRFLGFREVNTNLPTGGRIERDYTYEIQNDAQGRLIAETTYNREEDGTLAPTTHRTWTWESLPLFADNALHPTFTFSAVETTYTLAPGAADVIADAEGVLRVQRDYAPVNHPQNGQVAQYVLRTTREDDRQGESTLERTKSTVSQVRYSADEYLILNTLTELSAQDLTDPAAGTELVSRVATEHNEQGQPVRVASAIDADRSAVTVNEFDPATGNLIATTKPQQVADGGTLKKTFDYGPHGIYLTRTTNELGHEVLATYDAGLGVVLVQQGPNVKEVGDSLARETQQWEYDGFGRVTEHLVSVDDPQSGYRLEPVQRFSYFDRRAPRQVDEQTRRDFASDSWATTSRLLDGAGRVISGTQYVDGTPIVTRYAYAADGSLASIVAPDPTLDDGVITSDRLAVGDHWTSLPAAASDIAVGADGTVWMAGTNQTSGSANLYRLTESGWEQAAGTAKRVAVDPEGNPWMVNNKSYIYRRINNVWERLPGKGTDIAVGADGTAWVIGTKAQSGGYGIYRWTGSDWQQVSGGAVRIAVDPQGVPWVVNNVGRIYRWGASGWQRMPGQARDIGVGADGSVWVIGWTQYADGAGVYRWTGSSWRQISGLGAQITVDPNGLPLVVNLQGQIVRRAIFKFTYAYDGLGRMTQFTRPDGTGVSIDYAGLTQAVAEKTNDGSGGSSRARSDAFGRLVEVQELGVGQPAVSSYTYDAQGGIVEIRDADGNLTQIEYDLLGRRTAITRGERTWRYGYDLNGNLISETTPTPQDASNADFTTVFEFDALDRIARRTPASRGMDDARLAELGIGAIEYYYDGIEGPAENAVGQLSRVQLPFGEVLYTYNAQSLAIREERSFQIDYLVSASSTQWVEREFDPRGLPTFVRHDDGTQSTYAYDERGLISTVAWYDPTPQSWKRVADYNRSQGGRVLSRGSDFNQRRQVEYDILGRPIHDTIFGAAAALAERRYTFNDSGDLTSVTGHTLGVSADAVYSYDAQHRLISAQGPHGYQAAFTHSPAGNVLSAQVAWNGSSTARDVSYVYSEVDPQAVEKLIDRATGDAWAEFAYDESGNTISRQTVEGAWSFVWDGEDQMREAEGPAGREAYYYDHMGQRMLAVKSDGVRFWFGDSETHFDANGAETTRYVHIGGAGGTLARVENGREIELQYSDSLQNLMLTVDAAGAASSAFLYGGFGELVYSQGAEDHTRRFNGKEDDDATGLRYYGARYYDPLTLRWTSADPLYEYVPDLGRDNPQEMNRYAFSLNNPLKFLDPDGRQVRTDEGLGHKAEQGDVAVNVGAIVEDAVVGSVCLLMGCNAANAPTDHSGPTIPNKTVTEEVVDYSTFAASAIGGHFLGRWLGAAVKGAGAAADEVAAAAVADSASGIALADTGSVAFADTAAGTAQAASGGVRTSSRFASKYKFWSSKVTDSNMASRLAEADTFFEQRLGQLLDARPSGDFGGGIRALQQAADETVEKFGFDLFHYLD